VARWWRSLALAAPLAPAVAITAAARAIPTALLATSGAGGRRAVCGRISALAAPAASITLAAIAAPLARFARLAARLASARRSLRRL